MVKRVEIVAYQERWPIEFESTKAGLHAALGNLAVHIDHIGSTAVPGLAAKDVIDVQVSVENLGHKGIADRLVNAGRWIRARARCDLR